MSKSPAPGDDGEESKAPPDLEESERQGDKSPDDSTLIKGSDHAAQDQGETESSPVGQSKEGEGHEDETLESSIVDQPEQKEYEGSFQSTAEQASLQSTAEQASLQSTVDSLQSTTESEQAATVQTSTPERAYQDRDAKFRITREYLGKDYEDEVGASIPSVKLLKNYEQSDGTPEVSGSTPDDSDEKAEVLRVAVSETHPANRLESPIYQSQDSRRGSKSDSALRTMSIEINKGSSDLSNSLDGDEIEPQSRHARRSSRMVNAFLSKPVFSDGFVPPDGCNGNPLWLLRLQFNFGYDSFRRANLHALDNDTLLMTSGSYVHIIARSMKEDIFVRCSGVGSVSCVCVHPSGDFFATGESGHWPIINIYRYPSLTVVKVLEEGTAREYVSVEFSPYDGNMLVSQGGAPDHFLTIWDWRKEMPILRTKSFVQDVYRVTFTKDLKGNLVSCGQGHIRFWTMARTFTGLKLLGRSGRFSQRSHSDIEAFLQFQDGKVLSSSEEGTLLLFDDGLLKAEFSTLQYNACHKGTINQMFLHAGELLTMGEDGYLRSWEIEKLLYVEPETDGELFYITPIEEIQVGKHAALKYMTFTPGVYEDHEKDIWYIQDKSGKIWSMDMKTATSNISGSKVLMQFHGGPVNGCAPSPTYHLMATIGEDGYLRFFDCILQVEVLTMAFDSPISAIQWIPLTVDFMGASVVLGFDNGAIRKVAFCKSKRLESSARYKMDGKLSQVLRPHKQRVTSIAFHHDSNMMATASLDETVFLFYVEECIIRVFGWVHLPSAVTQIIWTPRLFSYNAILAVCQDGLVLELLIPNDKDSLKFTDNYEFTNMKMKLFKFLSVKSEYEHQLELKRIMSDFRKEAEALDEACAEAEHESPIKLKPSKEQEPVSDLPIESFQKFPTEITNRRQTVAGPLFHKRKAVEREEEEWEPFIPPIPCPITQALYAGDEATFWITLGEYDRGYLYLCQFPNRIFVKGQDNPETFLTKPVECVPIPECPDATVTVMHLESSKGELMLGFSNGYIRFVQVDFKHFSDISRYWQINIHDYITGSITGIEYGCNGYYLLTTGMDGNILLFSFAQKLEQIWQLAPGFPQNADHHSTCEDIASDALCLADEITRIKHEQTLEHANKVKKLAKQAVMELRQSFRQVINENEQIPKSIRLSRTDLLINTNLYEESYMIQQERILEEKKKLAWESERSRIFLEKVQNDLTHHEKCPDVFTVRSFNQEFKVKSYRIPQVNPLLKSHLHKISSKPLEEPEAVKSAESVVDLEVSRELSLTQQMYLAAQNLTKRKSLHFDGQIARTLKTTLRKASISRQRRNKRQEQWKQLYEEKARIEKDNPEDLAAIEIAKKTVGNLVLKTDPVAYERIQKQQRCSARSHIARLDEDTRHKMSNFNFKLEKLREERLVIIQICHAIEKRICQASHGTLGIDCLPLLTEEEVPEHQYVYDETVLGSTTDTHSSDKSNKGGSTVSRMSMKSSQSVAHSMTSVSAAGAVLEGKKREQRRYKYYKGERTDTLPEIVSFFLTQDSVHDLQDKSLKFQSHESLKVKVPPLQIQMNKFKQIELENEVKIKNSLLEYLQDEFDYKLNKLRLERFKLDVYLWKATLVSLEKLEEDSIDQTTKLDEKRLHEQIDTIGKDLDKNNKLCGNLTKKIGMVNERIEDIVKQTAQLWNDFNTACKDVNLRQSELRFLTLLFKRKLRKKQEQSLSEEQSSGSESSSFSSLDMASGSEASFEFDLTVCPPSINIDLYNLVYSLQKERQTHDDNHTELKNKQLQLQKELDQKTKDSDALKKTLHSVKDNQLKFYKEKMRALNELVVLITLYDRRMYERVPRSLVVEISTLIRLNERVKELKQDIKEQVQIIQGHSKQNYMFLRANRLLRVKIAEKERQCEDEILKKFGRHVDLRTLELVTINPEAELLRCQFHSLRDEQRKEINVLDSEIKDLREQRVGQIDLNTDYMVMQADTLSAIMKISNELDNSFKQLRTTRDLLHAKERMGDRNLLFMTNLVEEQADVIACCWDQIHRLAQPHSKLGRNSSDYLSSFTNIDPFNPRTYYDNVDAMMDSVASSHSTTVSTKLMRYSYLPKQLESLTHAPKQVESRTHCRRTKSKTLSTSNTRQVESTENVVKVKSAGRTKSLSVTSLLPIKRERVTLSPQMARRRSERRSSKVMQIFRNSEVPKTIPDTPKPKPRKHLRK